LVLVIGLNLTELSGYAPHQIRFRTLPHIMLFEATPDHAKRDRFITDYTDSIHYPYYSVMIRKSADLFTFIRAR